MLAPIAEDQTSESELQTSLSGRAGRQTQVVSTTQVGDRDDVMRADRLVSAGDLVDVLTIITELVAGILDVEPFELAHIELRSELERSFTGVGFRRQALERIGSNDEPNLVRSQNPGRIAPGT